MLNTKLFKIHMIGLEDSFLLYCFCCLSARSRRATRWRWSSTRFIVLLTILFLLSQCPFSTRHQVAMVLHQVYCIIDNTVLAVSVPVLDAPPGSDGPPPGGARWPERHLPAVRDGVHHDRAAHLTYQEDTRQGRGKHPKMCLVWIHHQ